MNILKKSLLVGLCLFFLNGCLIFHRDFFSDSPSFFKGYGQFVYKSPDTFLSGNLVYFQNPDQGFTMDFLDHFGFTRFRALFGFNFLDWFDFNKKCFLNLKNFSMVTKKITGFPFTINELEKLIVLEPWPTTPRRIRYLNDKTVSSLNIYYEPGQEEYHGTVKLELKEIGKLFEIRWQSLRKSMGRSNQLYEIPEDWEQCSLEF